MNHNSLEFYLIETINYSKNVIEFGLSTLKMSLMRKMVFVNVGSLKIGFDFFRLKSLEILYFISLLFE